MIVYRIVKSIKRSDDISGIGSFQTPGRWHNEGTYILYTSTNSSLAFLENLPYLEPLNLPPHLYVMSIELKCSEEDIYTLPDQSYPPHWMEDENAKCRKMGTLLMSEKKYFAVKVWSKINPYEYNYLLNPLFPRYHDIVKVVSVEKLPIDMRLVRGK